MLGVYISGHPLEEYVATLEKNITRTTADFQVVDGETEPKVKDQERAVIGRYDYRTNGKSNPYE